MITDYNQNISANLDDSQLKKQVTRIFPSVTYDAKVGFERDLLC
ncbi:hypothetical protein [Arsenophonus endosymbiont of Aleurodicus dispersus]|nr:hypothetical protein [Arsenophonus endosymbiont of Aleurodicus dispersus]